MATSNVSTKCCICEEERITYPCSGCSEYFCFKDLAGHRESFKLQLHEIEHKRNEFAEILKDQKTNSNNHPLLKQIAQWEQESIKKIQITAQEYRQLLQQSVGDHIQKVEGKLKLFTEEIEKIATKEDFNEITLGTFKEKLADLRKLLNQPADIQIKEESSTIFIKKLSIITNTRGKILSLDFHCQVGFYCFQINRAMLFLSYRTTISVFRQTAQ